MSVDPEAAEGVQMSDTEISVLPNEIMESIFCYFSNETLESASEVCTLWKSITEPIVSRRVISIQRSLPETLADLKTHFIGNDTDLKALRKFESLYMGPGFRFRNFTREQKNENSVVELVESCAEDFRSHLIVLTRPNDQEFLFELQNEFKSVPCHQLIIVVSNHNLIFYHESVIWTRAVTRYGPYPQYEVESMGLEADGLQDGVFHLDVYQDKVAVVYQEDDTLVLYQIVKVCHEKLKVTLRPLKRIFFRRRARAISLYKDKVYVIYSDWYMGVWNVSSDSAEAGLTSKGKVLFQERQSAADPDPDILLCRVNNLLFIRLSFSFGHKRSFSVSTWMILDMNEDSLDPVQVPMNEIKGRIIPMPTVESQYTISVLGLQISGNVLLFHAMRICTILSPYQSSQNFSCDDILVAVKLKLDPKKEDFLDMIKFDQLTDGPSDSMSLDIFLGFITALPSSCFGSTNPAFLGISNSKFPRAPVTTLELCNLED